MVGGGLVTVVVAGCLPFARGVFPAAVLAVRVTLGVWTADSSAAGPAAAGVPCLLRVRLVGIIRCYKVIKKFFTKPKSFARIYNSSNRDEPRHNVKRCQFLEQ